MSYRGSSRGGDSRGGSRGGRGGHTQSSEVLTRNPPSLDRKLSDFEDKSLKDSAKMDSAAGKFKMTRRPSYGTTGQAATVWANFFEIQLNPNQHFYRYSIQVSPELQPARLKKELFCLLLKSSRVRSVYGASDMSQELITAGRMESTSPMIFELSGGKEPKKYTFKFSNGDAVNYPDLIKLLSQTKQSYPLVNEEVGVRALNIMMTRIPHRDPGVVITGRGRQKFFWIDERKQSCNLTGGLEVLRGFFTSVRLGADRLLLNMNVNHGTFYRPLPMNDFTTEFVAAFGTDRQMFHRYIRGLRVEVRHLPKEKDADGNLQYRRKSVWGTVTHKDGAKDEHKPTTHDIGSSPAHVEFWEKSKDGKSGKYTSVKDYFKKVYGMDKLANMPVLNVGTQDRPVYLPQDVCRILPGQTFNGELGTAQRQAMITFCCRRPPDNYVSIMQDGLKILGITDKKTKESGIKVHETMMAVPARFITPPTLRYGSGTQVPRGGSWNLRGLTFAAPAPPPQRWGFLCILNRKKLRSHQEDQWRADNQPVKAAQNFKKSLNVLGLRWQEPIFFHRKVVFYEPEGLDYRKVIDKAMEEFKDVQCPLVVIPMHESEDKAFNYIKWAGDCKNGILTHCCKAEKFFGGDMQYLANNAMKVNLKMSGICQSLDSASKCPKVVKDAKTMIVGLDVTHPSVTDPETYPSISAIVASTDGRMGQWPGEIRLQGRREEVIHDVGLMLESRIKRWTKENKGELPRNILIYRDGVSEGQFEKVINQELLAIQTNCKRIYGNKPHRISIVVVTKRHHTRFFPTKSSDHDRNSNPNPGLCVDRGITRPGMWDFYLQAQAAIMGSARPAHYIAVHDEIFTSGTLNYANPSNELQELTNAICYMMGRCTRSVSYCTPAFLADRLCDRARKYVLAYYNEDWDRLGQRNPHTAAPTQAQVNLHHRTSEAMVYI
ncbi:hypothetical protein N7520_001131 [Penicillium odoratum]|uniref:uncharacterized protein n=1 Tax=Penicillium odoratum TaxID=1167516 RepID=UPI0025480967|nr:uncharacterized protein N7520_001131 [Penicillium odoratum]KAJ5777885.1 hypothetical protein N7520_001131 [Penicillium odoratum]